ncbi:hypothetical protein [Chitinophaga sp.]|uniref:hypothetical protein n=1 Tax=Chitinophaga sp. TaxID=1869181 RepID=UPI0031D696A2
MNNILFSLLLIVTVITCSCTVQKQSRFTTDRIKPGMTKEAVIALYGKPYKESTFTDSNHVVHEHLYYKEHIWVRNWYEINNILHFQNSVLQSLEQGDEHLVDKREVVVK